MKKFVKFLLGLTAVAASSRWYIVFLEKCSDERLSG